MFKRIQSDQKGAAAMITVIVLAIILTTLTTAMLRLAIVERRDSTDDDLSTRAYYAAESGVEDAKRGITEFLNGSLAIGDLRGAQCAGINDSAYQTLLSSDLDTEYTCQLINLSPSTFEADLAEGEAISVPTRGASPFTWIRISWHEDGADAPFGGLSAAANDLPNRGSWDAPAMIRTSFINYDNTGATVAAGSIGDTSTFLYPISTAGSTSFASPGADGRLQGVTCQPSGSSVGSRLCTVDIDTPDDLQMLRIKALYGGANISVQLCNQTGAGLNCDVEIVDAQAVIDVTGRAGDVFRRVETRVLLDQGDTLGIDHAILSADSICKNFRITDDVADFDSPSFNTGTLVDDAYYSGAPGPGDQFTTYLCN